MARGCARAVRGRLHGNVSARRGSRSVHRVQCEQLIGRPRRLSTYPTLIGEALLSLGVVRVGQRCGDFADELLLEAVDEEVATVVQTEVELAGRLSRPGAEPFELDRGVGPPSERRDRAA